MGDFNWKIWFEKWGKGALLIAGITVIDYTATYVVANPVPAEYAFWVGVAMVTLQQIGNWVKHTYFPGSA